MIDFKDNGPLWPPSHEQPKTPTMDKAKVIEKLLKIISNVTMLFVSENF